MLFQFGGEGRYVAVVILSHISIVLEGLPVISRRPVGDIHHHRRCRHLLQGEDVRRRLGDW